MDPNMQKESSTPIRRCVRPVFAEDVYGENRTTSTSTSTAPLSLPGTSDSESNMEYSDSSLAQRRQVSLLKLKQLKDPLSPAGTETTEIPITHHQEQVDAAEKDIPFNYTDCDNIATELSELYSYSELEDFAKNYQCWKSFADNEQIDQFHLLPEDKKKFVIMHLCEKMESVESDVRLSNCRILLYILQGAFVEFAEEEELEAGVPLKSPENRGTGGFENDCIQRAYQYAHVAYSAGAYQSLCSLLLTEVTEPFDTGLPIDGRISKASSRDSHSASNMDLSDHRNKKIATLADNETLRVVLACLCHMVELIRDEELAEGDSSFLKKREMFKNELEEPIDNYGQPLLYLLFEMMPQFYKGEAPHFPVKKIFILTWKILLFILGGWDAVREVKERKRTERNLPLVEDTLTTAAKFPAILISEGEAATRPAPKKTTASRIGAMALARQMACSGSEEGKLDDDDAFTVGTSSDESTACSSRTSRQNSGDRTPRALSPILAPPKKVLPWRSKVSQKEIESFIQQERMKFFNYQLKGDMTTLFGLPPPIKSALTILQKNLYISVAEQEAKEDENLNRFLLSKKEVIELNSTEKLYRMLLPNMVQYIVAILKVLLAAAPSTKAKNDGLSILIDVLTADADGNDILSNSISLDRSTSNPLEDSVRLTIDINRHKEILVKASSAILILLCKHLKANHVFQFEYLVQHVVYGNGIPLLLKFLDQNMTRYIQSRNEIHAYNYPQSCLHYIRNREEWPALNPDNVEDNSTCDVYFMWRNVFSSINLVRILNKLVKGRPSRVMMLVVFKSAPILKRSLKIRQGTFQLYVLKVLKMQSRYLGRQWRRINMDVMSAIYSRVRHRMTDDWAFANETKKSYEYQIEETELRTAVERFHSRRYACICPNLAIDVNDAPLPGDDYLNRVDLRDFTPVDKCINSVLGTRIELGDKFKRNYEAWMEQEVLRRQTDWNKLLMNVNGFCKLDCVTD